MKPRRNDPCPCGSGKKYKKCCLPNERDEGGADSTWSYAGKLHRIQHADDYPVDACYVNADWKEQGIARILVTRIQDDGKIMLGAFLVDLCCLGVKNAFCNEGLTRKQIDHEFLGRYYQGADPTRIGINFAKEIIYGAVAFAKNLGFEPHPDFKLSRRVLGKEEFTLARGLKFGGPNGKPLYVAGSDDDAPSVLRKLRQRLGDDGFEYITPAEDWDAMEEDEVDQPGLFSPMVSRAAESMDSDLRTYKRLRQVGMDLMSAVLETLPRELPLQAARDLRLLDKKGRIICDTEDELSFIMDRAIHDIPWPEQRFIEIFQQREGAKLPLEQQAHVEAHIQPVFSLYEVSKVSRGRGVWLVDLFRPQEFFLMDTGLGMTIEEGCLLASRVIHLQGIHFTSGVSTPFGREYKKRLTDHFASLAQDKEEPGSWEKVMRLHAPYFFIEFKKTGVGVAFSPVS